MGQFRLPPYQLKAIYDVAGLSETVDWGLSALGVPASWAKSKGKGVIVACLDNGYDKSHQDLAGRVKEFRDFTGEGDAPGGHGTHTLGTIGAAANGVGIIGVAPEATLIVGKVLSSSGAGQSEWVSAGIRWAADAGAKIISLSLGGPDDDRQMRSSVDYAASKGCILVCAAGNDGPNGGVGYPGAYDSAIAVAAVNKNMQVSSFSSRGPEVDVAAPGEDIVSCWPGNRYARLSGTSMATPFVSGVCALVEGCRLSEHPGASLHTAQGILDLIRSTSKDIDIAGQDPASGWGVISPEKIIDAGSGADASQPGAGEENVVGRWVVGGMVVTVRLAKSGICLCTSVAEAA